jgi:hypothetical protein
VTKKWSSVRSDGSTKRSASKRRRQTEKRSVFDLDETPSFVDPEFDKMEESEESIVERARNHGRLY